MKILVTGASGFIGAALISALKAQGDTIVATSRLPNLLQRDGVTWHPADLGGGVDWHNLCQDVELIYHLAWASLPASSQVDPAADASTNVVGTLRLLQALRSNSKVRFVFASSGGTVYGELEGEAAREDHPTRPLTPHGVAKLAVENYLRVFAGQWGLDAVSARIGNPYGPSQRTDRVFGAVTTAVSRGLNRKPWTIFGDGSVVRDYVYVDDLVSALVALGRLRGGPGAINIGSGEGRSLNEIATLVGDELGHEMTVRFEASRRFDVSRSILDIRLAREVLGWEPLTSLREGIAATHAGLVAQSS